MGAACKQKWTQSISDFEKNEGSKKSQNNEKGYQENRKSRENWYKMLQNGQMTYFCYKLDQLYAKLSLALNIIDTNLFFSSESVCQYDQVWHKKGPNGIGKRPKGGQSWGISLPSSSIGVLPTWENPLP